MTEILKIGTAQIYHGDYMDIVADVDVDAVLTDPPYGMNYRSNYNKSRKAVASRMMRKDGDFAPIHGDNSPFDPSALIDLQVPSILFGGNYFADKLPSGAKWIVWNKLCGKTAMPSASDVELAWSNLKGPSRIYDHLWRGMFRAGEENVSRGGKLHPHQKPVELMIWCLKQLPNSVTTIFDPFMGSGTVGVACARLGLNYVGCEIMQSYFDIAKKRIEGAQHVGLIEQTDFFHKQGGAA